MAPTPPGWKPTPQTSIRLTQVKWCEEHSQLALAISAVVYRAVQIVVVLCLFCLDRVPLQWVKSRKRKVKCALF